MFAVNNGSQIPQVVHYTTPKFSMVQPKAQSYNDGRSCGNSVRSQSQGVRRFVRYSEGNQQWQKEVTFIADKEKEKAIDAYGDNTKKEESVRRIKRVSIKSLADIRSDGQKVSNQIKENRLYQSDAYGIEEQAFIPLKHEPQQTIVPLKQETEQKVIIKEPARETEDFKKAKKELTKSEAMVLSLHSINKFEKQMEQLYFPILEQPKDIKQKPFFSQQNFLILTNISQPRPRMLEKSTMKNDMANGKIHMPQGNNNNDYKFLYFNEKEKVENLEHEMKKAKETVKKVKNEKISLIQNYERLIKKLHSIKNVESQFAKVEAEKNMLAKEVAHLEDKVTVVKEGNLTNSLLESTTMFKKNLRSKIMNQMKSSVIKESQVQVSRKNIRSTRNNNLFLIQDEDAENSNISNCRSSVAKYNDFMARSGKMNVNRQCNGIGDYMKGLGADVLEVTINGKTMIRQGSGWVNKQ